MSIKSFTSKVPNTDIYRRFFQEVEEYQSNHYGAYNRKRLVAAYNNLPLEVKQFLTPKSDRLNQLYRGADGLSPKPAISFSNMNVAPLFGAFVIPFRELKTYDGLIDTEKVYKLLTLFKMNYDIGDDEGEVIVINPDWKEFDIEQYRNGNNNILSNNEEVLPNATLPPVVGVGNRPELDLILNQYIDEELNDLNVVRHSKRFLYHSTNIKNFEDIKAHGLYPMFGDTVRQAYGDTYDLDRHGKDDELAQLPGDFEGILFFSEKPMLGYSQGMQNNPYKPEEAVLCIVEKNDTIFRKTSDYPEYTNYKGQTVTSIDYVEVTHLPLIIETGDWFSFEHQDVKHILTGQEIILFMKLNFPKEYNDLISRIKH